MTVTRRQTIKGLGLLFGGGSAEILRAATAQAEAHNGVTVGVVPDADANFRIEPGIEGSDYVRYEDSKENGLSITLTNINLGAMTRFEDLLKFTNDGVNAVTSISTSVTGGDEHSRVRVEPQTPLPIDPGETTTGMALVIDTTDVADVGSIASMQVTITIAVHTDA